MSAKPRFTAEPYTLQYAEAPAYFYVWDSLHKAMRGGRFSTREDAQREADRREAAAEQGSRK